MTTDLAGQLAHQDGGYERVCWRGGERVRPWQIYAQKPDHYALLLASYYKPLCSGLGAIMLL